MNLNNGKNYYLTNCQWMLIKEPQYDTMMESEMKESLNSQCGMSQDMLPSVYTSMVERNKISFTPFKNTTMYFYLTLPEVLKRNMNIYTISQKQLKMDILPLQNINQDR